MLLSVHNKWLRIENCSMLLSVHRIDVVILECHGEGFGHQETRFHLTHSISCNGLDHGERGLQRLSLPFSNEEAG